MSKDPCEKEVYRSIFSEHAEKIRNFIYYKSKNLSLSEDLVQEAFIKLWENCKKVEYEKARSFLYTVANNLFLNQMNRDKTALKFEQQQQQKSAVHAPDFLLEEEEFRQRLEQAINNLPEDQRLVFLMNRIDKKKYREIAEELNISTKAVEKRMHKALLALRQIHKKV